MENIKVPNNKYQHKLIVLISTLNYINSNLEQYTQSDVLYYFNSNLKRNGQREVKIKTLQSYLYKLGTVFKITNNYYKHLGINMGTEVYYKLKYSKKECYRIVNKHFKDTKKNKYKIRVNSYFKKNCIKNSSVEKKECYCNIYNNKKEKKKNIVSTEKLQIKKYIKKCNFQSNIFYSILNLRLEKKDAIEVCKMLKRFENSIEKKVYRKINGIKLITASRLKNKQKELKRILNKIKNGLENENYDNKQLEIQIKDIYKQYKNKPHFIIENNKYYDLEKIVVKLKNNLKHVKTNTKESKTNIKNNIFNILIEQLKNKVEIEILIPILKNYLNKQNKLEYSKVLSNYYYYEILKKIEPNERYSQSKEFKKNAN
ncbi:plasmid maintenance protein [Borreliella bavariensis]|uniref:plasmid maintenance protein n=1 Tax=Borreliella bavariensis TaxID=664662 RepID=UPI001BFFDDED|nr:plasmid maintenance protein [Borreliella bavariensis]